MYDKCYFCLDQLPKLKKESTASFFVNFGRSRGTKEPTYITVHLWYYAMLLMLCVSCALLLTTVLYIFGFSLLACSDFKRKDVGSITMGFDLRNKGLSWKQVFHILCTNCKIGPKNKHCAPDKHQVELAMQKFCHLASILSLTTR